MDDASYLGNVVNDCKKLVSSIGTVRIEKCHCTATVAAHRVARSAIYLPEHFTWEGPFGFLTSFTLYSPLDYEA